jgi:hypothetical protein
VGKGTNFFIIKLTVMSKVFYIKETIISFLLTFIFGMRVQGEPINLEYGTQVSFTTSDPDDRPEEFSWYREFRVGCLHGKQKVYL